MGFREWMTTPGNLWRQIERDHAWYTSCYEKLLLQRDPFSDLRAVRSYRAKIQELQGLLYPLRNKLAELYQQFQQAKMADSSCSTVLKIKQMYRDLSQDKKVFPRLDKDAQDAQETLSYLRKKGIREISFTNGRASARSSPGLRVQR